MQVAVVDGKPGGCCSWWQHSCCPMALERGCTHACACCCWLYCCSLALPGCSAQPLNFYKRLLLLLQMERTPLHLAAEKGHLKAVKVLLAAGAAFYVLDWVSPAPFSFYLAHYHFGGGVAVTTSG